MNLDWLGIAKKLSCGRHTRVKCCKGDASLVIYHTDTGYSCHCFRCGRHSFEPHGVRSISDIERHKAEKKFIESKGVALPDDYTQEIPTEFALWFMKAGITPEVARDYGFGFSPSTQRVVLPVFENGKLTAVQQRAVYDWQKPKYLNPFGPSVSSALFWGAEPSSGVCVVVEAILDAIQVSRVLPAVSILGSHMTDVRAMKIAAKTHSVIVWLDGDKAGDKGAVQTIKALKFQGLNVSRVRSDKDPKEYSYKETEELIRSAKTC